MPPKPFTEKDHRDLERHFANMGTAIFEVPKEITREEEDTYMKNVFYDLRMKGYDHIHTIEVIPEDGREPYTIVDTELT
jgi:hypothetical protein